MSTSREPKLVLVALMLGIAVASAPWFLGHWTCHGNAGTSVWVFCIVTSLWLKTGKKWLGMVRKGNHHLKCPDLVGQRNIMKYCNWPELYVCALHFGQDSVLILIQFWWDDALSWYLLVSTSSRGVWMSLSPGVQLEVWYPRWGGGDHLWPSPLGTFPTCSLCDAWPRWLRKPPLLRKKMPWRCDWTISFS